MGPMSTSLHALERIPEKTVDFSEYNNNNFAEANEAIVRFLEDVYVTKRIHSPLGYHTLVGLETA